MDDRDGEKMHSSVVTASAGCIRNAVALRDFFALTVSSCAPDFLELPGLLMEVNALRLTLEIKSLKLSESTADLESLQEIAVIWLRSHPANVHGANSVNCSPFSPAAKCPF